MHTTQPWRDLPHSGASPVGARKGRRPAMAATTASAAPPTQPELLNAALAYATSGLPVLPLHTTLPTGGCSCRDGHDCGSPGKHPRLADGAHSAATDPDHIRGWWHHWPDANLGVATGTTLDVCDIDTNAGLRAVLDILDVVRPVGPLVRTGHGWHLWFAGTGHRNRVGMLPGVDWRGVGGYAVAPPSWHQRGRRYRFQQPFTGTAALPLCPPALRRIVVRPPPLTAPGRAEIDDLDRYSQAALDSEVGRIRTAPRPLYRNGRRVASGGRNTALHLAAFRLGQLAAHGAINRQTVWTRLSDVAQDVGLGRTEAHRTIASGWRAGLRRPRR